MMQEALFPDDDPPVTPVTKLSASQAAKVRPQPPTLDIIELAAALPRLVHLGTSSWTFPGWKGLVWEGDYSDAQLSKHGLASYASTRCFVASAWIARFTAP